MIGGVEPETIHFYIDDKDASKQRIGSSTVWAWPFPEVCTVGEALQAQGSTDVKMGTAPELWNVILVAMAKVQHSYPNLLHFCTGFIHQVACCHCKHWGAHTVDKGSGKRKDVVVT